MNNAEQIKATLKKPISKGTDVFIAPNATVLGNVVLGNEVSIWFGAVLRGDNDLIQIGDRSNVQDNAVIHVDPNCPVIIGEECIVGHSAIIHGATIANNVLVGMHSTILNKASIGEFSIIGANALVTEGTQIPPYSLVMGTPAKVVKQISPEQVEKIKQNAQNYVSLSKVYIEVLNG
ncbi:MAG: gamma carbonic anhydrase family protein [Bacteroidota bacterium]